MAKQTVTVTRCDFDNTEGATTVPFGLDGRQYEIDLSPKREKQLREALAPYVDHARKAGAQPRTVVRSTRAPNSVMSDKERNTAIRQWAIAQGYDVSERGRIAAAIIAEYDDAEVGR